MNPFIWCAVGAVAGWVAASLLPGAGLTNRVECVLVAIFGAFIGGEFLAAMLVGEPAVDSGFQVSSLGLAVAGAVVMLALLGIMRKAVGPMRPHKVRKKR